MTSSWFLRNILSGDDTTSDLIRTWTNQTGEVIMAEEQEGVYIRFITGASGTEKGFKLGIVVRPSHDGKF